MFLSGSKIYCCKIYPTPLNILLSCSQMKVGIVLPGFALDSQIFWEPGLRVKETASCRRRHASAIFAQGMWRS